MKSLILFSRRECHLCDDAEELLAAAGFEYGHVDIENDLALVSRYGVRIPVLRRADGAELGWPFDLEALRAFAAE